VEGAEILSRVTNATADAHEVFDHIDDLGLGFDLWTDEVSLFSSLKSSLDKSLPLSCSSLHAASQW
jgi:hypothetical protein